jgi:hypothetical protein
VLQVPPAPLRIHHRSALRGKDHFACPEFEKLNDLGTKEIAQPRTVMAAVKAPKPGLTGHTAGIFADMSLDGPEIGTLVAVIDRARNLPNRKTIGKQDPYCAMRLGKEAKKTETDRRGGQTPKW